jgi:hypothetical protein
MHSGSYKRFVPKNWWTGRDLNPRLLPISAQGMRRQRSYQTEPPAPLLPFESRTIFNVIERGRLRKKQFYSMRGYGVYSDVGDALGWTVSDLGGTDIFWICARLFLNVPPATGERQAA